MAKSSYYRELFVCRAKYAEHKEYVSMKYYKATVTTTSDFADTLSVILIDFGSSGANVADGEDIRRVLAEHNWDYADESLLSKIDPHAYVSGYYPEDFDFAPLAERLNVLRSEGDPSVGSLELHLQLIDSADYENEWKKYYAPIELDSLVIVPEWLDCDSKKLQVRIDPGMAFGTGSHETTKLCLGFLEHISLAGKRVADVGCGSGILGAAALKLGAAQCFLADIDAQAVEAAKRNCALNGVMERAEIIQGTLPVKTEEKFAVIVANITADVLIGLCESFFGALESDGYVVMSGIIHSRVEDVKAAYLRHFALTEQKVDGEWVGFLWQRKESR